MRRLATVAGAALALLAAPGTAAADVIFAPADAEELASTLAEAHREQGICYGWRVDVDNIGNRETSVGSNFGAGESLQDHSAECDTSVEFLATITWTSEASDAEDSASYSVSSIPRGPTTADLNSLEIISDDGLAGENPDLEVYKAVSALPLLAADAGLADPIEASPATGAPPAGAQPTDSPGSDFLREAGGALLWAGIMLVAAVVVLIWALNTRPARAEPPPGPPAERTKPDPETRPER